MTSPLSFSSTVTPSSATVSQLGGSPRTDPYVFRVLTHRRPTSQLPTADPILDNRAETGPLRGIAMREQLKKSTTTLNDSPLRDGSTEAEIKRLLQRNDSLQEALAKAGQENRQLRQRNQQLQGRGAELEAEKGRLEGERAALEEQKARLEAQIRRIKDEYVQTSLDCFQEYLRPQLEQVIALKSQLNSQIALRESTEASLAHASAHNRSLAGELAAKSEVFERQLRSQRLRMEVQLSDRDNQIQDLRNSLQTTRQRMALLSNELTLKDAFLLRLATSHQSPQI